MKSLLTIVVVALTFSVHAGERKSQKDIAYGEHKAQKLDVYWDSDFKKAPIVVNIHGGGWRSGDKMQFGSSQFQKLFVENLSCVLVSPNYRMIGDLTNNKRSKTQLIDSAGKIDAMMSDVASAVAFVQKNAAKYGADPKRVIVCGSSAGGHLSAALAYCNSTNWLKGTKYDGEKLNIIGWYGDCAPVDKKINPQIPFMDNAIPILHVDKEDPPGFMIVGTRDNLVPPENATKFQKVLSKNGIWSQVLLIEEGKHVVGKQFVLNEKTNAPFIAFVKYVTGEGKAPPSGGVTKSSLPSRRR